MIVCKKTYTINRLATQLTGAISAVLFSTSVSALTGFTLEPLEALISRPTSMDINESGIVSGSSRGAEKDQTRQYQHQGFYQCNKRYV